MRGWGRQTAPHARCDPARSPAQPVLGGAFLPGGLLGRRLQRDLGAVRLPQPAPQHAVHRAPPRPAPPPPRPARTAPAGDSRNGRPCSPPSPPCEPICSSKACTSPSPGRRLELTMMSAVCGKVCGAPHGVGRAGPEARPAGPGVLVEPVERELARRRAPSTTAAVLLAAHQQEADAGMVGEGGQQRGVTARRSPRWLIRCGTSGKEIRPRLPEASTTGSGRRPAGPVPGLSSTGRRSAARDGLAGLGAAVGALRPRGTGSPQPARTRSSSVSPYAPAKVSPGLWPWSESSTIR